MRKAKWFTWLFSHQKFSQNTHIPWKCFISTERLFPVDMISLHILQAALVKTVCCRNKAKACNSQTTLFSCCSSEDRSCFQHTLTTVFKFKKRMICRQRLRLCDIQTSSCNLTIDQCLVQVILVHYATPVGKRRTKYLSVPGHLLCVAALAAKSLSYLVKVLTTGLDRLEGSFIINSEAKGLQYCSPAWIILYYVRDQLI